MKSLSSNFYAAAPVYTDTKHRKIILARTNVVNRYLDYIAQTSNIAIDELLVEYKQKFNLEFERVEGNLDFQTSVKLLQDKFKYELIASDVGINSIENGLCGAENL